MPCQHLAWDPKSLRFTILLLSADISETRWWNIPFLRNTRPQKMKTRSAYCSNCPLQGPIKVSADSPLPNAAQRQIASSCRLANVLFTQLLGRKDHDGYFWLFPPKVNVLLYKLWIRILGKLFFNASGTDFYSTHWPRMSQYLLLQKKRPRIKT